MLKNTFKNQCCKLSDSYIEILILLFTFINLLFSKITHFRDSGRYIKSAFNFELSDFDFWFGERSPGFPLIIKLAGDGFGLLAFHFLLSAFAWIFFYRTLKLIGKLKRDHFFNILFLFVSFSSVFTSWNFAVLTESASVSCILIILSILFRTMIKPFSVYHLAVIPVLFLFSFLRDFNSIIAFLIVLSSLLCFLFTKKKLFLSGLFIVSSGLLCFTLYSVNSLGHLGMRQRWILPALNNFSQRVMTHKDWSGISETHGIPVSKELLDLKGQWGTSENMSYYKTKQLENFRNWFLDHGDSLYRNFLIQYPENTLKIIKSHFFKAYQIIDCSTCREYADWKYRPFFLKTPTAVIFLLIVFWLLKQLKILRSQKNQEPLNPLFLFFMSLSFISVFCVCLVILADSLEIQRHSIIPLLLAVVSLITMGLSMKGSQGLESIKDKTRKKFYNKHDPTPEKRDIDH